MEKELKIEVGKFYRTYDGSKVRIYALDGGGDHSTHGASQNGNGTWTPDSWTKCGRYNRAAKSSENELDIKEEWIV